MNDVQHAAVVKVENDRAAVRALSGRLAEAERKLRRSETDLRAAIRRDPASWNTISMVKES